MIKAAYHVPQGARNVVGFEYNNKLMLVYGGPYREKPAGAMPGVCLTETVDYGHQDELLTGATYHYPIQDFSVPDDPKSFTDAVMWGLQQAYRTGHVWVGCMGGIGRTGMVMAAMYKVLGSDTPIRDVRAHYFQGAVETSEQENLIRSLSVWKARIKFWMWTKMYDRGWVK